VEGILAAETLEEAISSCGELVSEHSYVLFTNSCIHNIRCVRYSSFSSISLELGLPLLDDTCARFVVPKTSLFDFCPFTS
jgi:hypothetical protein